MPIAKQNFILALELKRDMVSLFSLDEAAARDVEKFVLSLKENPYSPGLLARSINNGDGSYYHRLPSGCYVSWEVSLSSNESPLGSFDGVVVRVTEAKFDEPDR